MTDEFDSPLFGRTRRATDAESATLACMAKEIPVAMFQALNRMFNERGLCISIVKKEEIQ